MCLQVFNNVHAVAAEHPSPDRAVIPVITVSGSESDPLSPVRPVLSSGAGVPLDDTPPKLVCNSLRICLY